jgi:hypothetical protein
VEKFFCSVYLLLKYKNTLAFPLKNCALSPSYGIVVVVVVVVVVVAEIK